MGCFPNLHYINGPAVLENKNSRTATAIYFIPNGPYLHQGAARMSAKILIDEGAERVKENQKISRYYTILLL